MPLYEYRCPNGHTVERIRSYVERDDPSPCPSCDTYGERLFPRTHRLPDGMYSYAPNLGDPDAHERKNQTIRDERGSKA